MGGTKFLWIFKSLRDLFGKIFIEKVESGSTIIGNDNRTISIDWSNKETYMRLEKELEEIKKALESKSHEEEVKIVEEALLAVKDVDESKFMKAVKCMGRETLNIAEGITGSILATLIM